MKQLALVLIVVALASCGPRTSGKSKSNTSTSNQTTTHNTTNGNNATNNTTVTNTTSTVAPNNGTCDGCVQGDTCLGGDSANACGLAGEQCFACADGWLCFEGACVEPPMCDSSNCNGCCDSVRGCVTGTDETACGSGGGTCSTCVGAEMCDGTTCVAPCADTCAGCCNGETCLMGSDDAACGTGGLACENCGNAASCSAQSVCVPDSCASSCAGCCDGNTCHAGNTAGACGDGGDACVTCGAGRACVGQICAVDPVSQWELVLVSGTMSTKNQMGDPWDIIGSIDPVVDFELIDGTTTTVYRATSSVVQDDSTPTWNESILTNVPAPAFRTWNVDVWDSDLDPDDPVCSMNIDLSNDPATFQDLFSGAVYTLSCSDPATGVFATLNIRLQ